MTVVVTGVDALTYESCGYPASLTGVGRIEAVATVLGGTALGISPCIGGVDPDAVTAEHSAEYPDTWAGEAIVE